MSSLKNQIIKIIKNQEKGNTSSNSYIIELKIYWKSSIDALKIRKLLKQIHLFILILFFYGLYIILNLFYLNINFCLNILWLNLAN